ncbi:MAG: aminodeoxychorismate/anthranilate synthase component II [Candidatus Zixiibacteriota bacterium]|nr:MAG: aminodeoxychorismate/anthranilate synthase component II [candidate division Zixibacteria bacterium]
MIVMLDNYDSFTYNIVQYLGELGAELTVWRNDEITVEQLLASRPEGIVLSPGPGRPEGAGIMLDLLKAVDRNLPVLGVCLGHQAIAQAYGARIGYAPKLMHGKTSEINHDGSRLFRGIPNPFTATRYHSLVVEKETLSPEFIVTAWTDDDVIMGIAHRQHPLFGVQFHPESIMTPHGKAILKNFLEVL